MKKFMVLFALTCVAIAGPGNNGGDALVAARHLFHFGLHPTILYPKVPNSSLFVNLQQQCSDLDIPILSETPNSIEPADYDLVLDGVFGFSFDPSNGIKDPFDKVVAALHRTDVPVACIDIPSGWDVEKGDIGKTGFQPHALISLTAPKMCAEFFTGKYHFLGGRFLPPRLAIKYGLSDLPKYHGTEQCALLQDSCLNNN